MSTWNESELKALATTDDLHIAPFREDGVTYGTPTWIWSVVVGGKLFVRAYSGQSSRWYKAAMRLKGGSITAAGMTRNVVFRPAPIEVQSVIDAAYKAKYSNSCYLKPMIGRQAQSATVEILPRRSDFRVGLKGGQDESQDGRNDRYSPVSRSLVCLKGGVAASLKIGFWGTTADLSTALLRSSGRDDKGWSYGFPQDRLWNTPRIEGEPILLGTK